MYTFFQTVYAFSSTVYAFLTLFGGVLMSAIDQYCIVYWSFRVKRGLYIYLQHLPGTMRTFLVVILPSRDHFLRHICAHRVPTIGQKKMSECEAQYRTTRTIRFFDVKL